MHVRICYNFHQSCRTLAPKVAIILHLETLKVVAREKIEFLFCWCTLNMMRVKILSFCWLGQGSLLPGLLLPGTIESKWRVTSLSRRTEEAASSLSLASCSNLHLSLVSSDNLGLRSRWLERGRDPGPSPLPVICSVPSPGYSASEEIEY